MRGAVQVISMRSVSAKVRTSGDITFNVTPDHEVPQGPGDTLREETYERQSAARAPASCPVALAGRRYTGDRHGPDLCTAPSRVRRRVPGRGHRRTAFRGRCESDPGWHGPLC